LLQPADFVQNSTVVTRFTWGPTYIGLGYFWQWRQAMFTMRYESGPKKYLSTWMSRYLREGYRKSRVTP